MRRRPAVTLLEVLIALFIMAIGMLALLVLFPLGAFSMGKALKDDRCASSAAMAEQLAIVSNLRHDTNVVSYFTTGLPSSYAGPSFPVYVDPYAVLGGLTTLGSGPGIQRVNPSYSVASAALVDRWFSLPNDIGFLSTGTPDLTSGSVERGRRYTWAYMLRRPQAPSDKAVDLTVVAYYNRPTAVPTPETVYAVSQTAVAAPKPMVTTTSGPTQGAGGLVLTGAALASFRRGMWILDISPITGTGANGVPAIPRSDFYRIVNVDDMGGGQIALDVQPNLICDNNPNGNPITQVVLMDHVAEVFPKGTSWQP